ncbi:hypothetical protein IWQ60_009729 [Tieghemiomyces parasiticus]|uniref:Uncharacterized protein n=1 Tax=Tieghemiomyces parasiticus TaxID=78921 RepID=A0A9W7ZM16_9FUNG|nr:hypothetical protein IWQ60_009729 [Tieghemiomyces parasiticus]
MCMRVTCPVCQKPTYKGCGKHIEQVLGDVPEADRCHCSREEKQKQSTQTDPSNVASKNAPNASA